MTIRRLAETQPETFAFSDENASWAKAEIEKYPPGRQASAVIPLLWRAQEQEGWVTRPAIEEVANILDMPTIRVLEVATFYTMFHLEPVGSVAHVQVCGTTPCMLRGAEELIAVCKRRIAGRPHERSSDGRFSWEEMECLGACVNAPMVQIGADTFEDLTPKTFERLLNALDKGRAVKPGPQVKRQFSAPATGLTSLTDINGKKVDTTPKPSPTEEGDRVPDDAPAAGAGVPPETPVAAEEQKGRPDPSDTAEAAAARARPNGRDAPAAVTPAVAAKRAPDSVKPARREAATAGAVARAAHPPETFSEPPAGSGDDLKKISGVGKKIEGLLHSLGIYTFRQIAAWTPENVTWVENRLSFRGRIERDDWIGQARRLAGGEGA